MNFNSASRAKMLVSQTIKTTTWLIVPTLVILSIWLPVLRHYYVPDTRISDYVLERARREPQEAVLQELRGDRLIYHGWKNSQQVVAAAERLLHGELHLNGHTPIRFRLPFHPQDLTPSLPSAQPSVAGLVGADLLLQAYESTGQEKFFRAACDSIVEFALYERGARLPRGLLWNDHAVANRVFVLSDFWRVYRRRDDFQPKVARTILELVARSGELLSRPEHFTFATNHGVMQNAALLRLRLSFPDLPNAEFFQRLAIERLGEQMAFYVNEEGVVLEHSADYQIFGIRLLKLVFQYMRLLEVPVPEQWRAKYTRAVQFAAQLRRPDGSLPLFGDTSWRWPEIQGEEGNSSRTAVKKAVPRGRGLDPLVAWYPLAGFAVWWDGLKDWPDSGTLSQTVVAFSFFPGHAHKHADDLSVSLWAGARTWWTNVGYWPYGLRERSQAESWSGSNAPHLLGEPKDSQRILRNLSHGWSERTTMLEVAREGPGAYFVRRQVIQLRPDVWLVLDSISGSPKLRSITRWTTGHGITLNQRKTEGAYLLQARNATARLFAFFLGSPDVSLRELPEVLGPFVRHSPRARHLTVPAVEVDQPANRSWAMAVWVFDANGTLGLADDMQPRMALWRGPEDWTAVVPRQSTMTEVSRRRDRLYVSEGRLVDTVRLRSADLTLKRAAIREAFLNAARKYPRFSDRLRYRQWGTYLLIVVTGVQELSFLASSRRFKKAHPRLRLLTLTLWIIGGFGLLLFFG